MNVGVVFPQVELEGDPDAARRFGVAVEELGYDHLLVYDHVLGASHDRTPKLWGPYTEWDPFHDPFVLLAHLAGITSRIEFATGVLVLPQRQTVLVGRQAADLDLLCGERLRLGVGTGWNYVEYEALGQDFSTRGSRLDEQIVLLRRLWTEHLLDFSGRFDRITAGNLVPRPRRQIPIWLGGFSERAFQRAAALGDGFVFAGAPGRAAQGLLRIRELLEGNGRNSAVFGADLVALGARSVDDVVDSVAGWEEAGGSHLSIVTMNLGLVGVDAHIEFIAKVRERLPVAR